MSAWKNMEKQVEIQQFKKLFTTTILRGDTFIYNRVHMVFKNKVEYIRIIITNLCTHLIT
jgi:hypothetical protein